MGTRTYGSSLLGCIIDDPKAMDYFIERYVKLNPDEFEDSDDPIDDMQIFLSCNELFRWGKDAGDQNARTFYAQSWGEDVFHEPVYLRQINGEVKEIYLPAIVIEADKGLLTSSVLDGNFYKSRGEIISEFKAKIGAYLPSDFDLEGSIGDIEYAITC